MSKQLQVLYDRDSDVLYLSVRFGVPARSVEGDPGLVWRYDIDRNELIGLTVMDFYSYWRPRANELSRQIAERLKMPEVEAQRALQSVH